MKHAITLAIILLGTSGCAAYRNAGEAGMTTDEPMTRGQQIAQDALIVDTHIDVPFRVLRSHEDVSQATEAGQFDYPRAKKGGLNAVFMSIYTPAGVDEAGNAKANAETLIDLVEGLARDHPDKFAMAYTTDQVGANFARGVISMPLGMENGGPIEGDLANLRHFYDRGIRYITLAHGKSNHISDSSYDANHQWHGLSEFGKRVVVAMNDLGIMVDVSHVSDDAFYQVMEVSRTPVIASHSSARYFTPGFERNMTDDMIRLLARGGGVIQITVGSAFISAATRAYTEETTAALTRYAEEHSLQPGSAEARAYAASYREAHPYPFATVDTILDHIDHVVGLVGIDHVGIGSDFDGVGDTLPVGFKDVSDYPNLVDGLLGRGYSEGDVRKILGGNLMRVWRQVEAYARIHRDDFDTLLAATPE